MEIQNISGATDVISRDFSIDTNVSNENAKVQKQEVRENSTIAEEKKGNNIDVRA